VNKTLIMLKSIETLDIKKYMLIVTDPKVVLLLCFPLVYIFSNVSSKKTFNGLFMEM